MTSFSDVFWIDASSESNINLCLKKIAKAHNLPLDSALHWIASQSGWLLVYDNADGEYQVVERFLPPGNKGNILITSRNKVFGRFTTSQSSLEVDSMGEEEAISLLLKSSMLNSNFVGDTANRIVTALGFIPLAIDQAGAYVLCCGCSLDSYLELYLKHREKLLSDPGFKGASDYGYSTYGTWEISMHEIEQRALDVSSKQGIAAQDALSLQRFLAYLHHENISEEIFLSAAINYQGMDKEEQNGLPPLISNLSSSDLFLSTNGEWDGIRFHTGIQVLLSFSLIKQNENCYSIHPLAHAWCRDRLSGAEAVRYCLRTRALLSCSVDFDYGRDNYALCIQLIPHIKESCAFSQKLGLENEYYDDEHMKIGFALSRGGNWQEAEIFFAC